MTAEAELLQRVRAGDGAALEGLLAPHTGALQRVARAVLGDREEAQDALQEVLVRAVMRLHSFDARRPLGPWLHRIMVNECLSRLRRRKRESAALAVWAETAAVSGPDSAGGEVLREVTRALALLPARQRTAIALVSFGGMDLRGTADAMGCSVGAVKSHLHRAREKLKRELGELLPEEGQSDGQLREAGAGTEGL